MRRLSHDFALSSLVAGFVAVLVGYTSSVALIFEAARAVGADPAQTATMLWALGLGMGLTSLALALRYRLPMLTAWSTPGAALLAGSHGLSFPDAVACFAACAALITLAGLTRAFERVMDRIPMALAAALLAGVLTRFGLDAVLSVRSAPVLVLVMLAVFLVGRRLWPRAAVPLVLVAGVLIAAAQGTLHVDGVAWQLTVPQWTTPHFDLTKLIGVALPLFVVTMASQNLPGVAAQRAAGYAMPVSPAITTTGAAMLVLAPFGALGLNLAAITAAICMSPEAHPDPARRYTAVVTAGLVYVALGLFGGTVAALLAAFPRELVVTVAGLALLSTIAGALATALKDERHRDAAALTFLVTLSGVTVAGVGSAFWGLVAGSLALLVQQWRSQGVPG